MAAKYILGALSVVFLVLGAMRMAGGTRNGGLHPQAKAWLLVGILFGAVSAWLFLQSA